jgi:hypothetical protein
MKLKPLDPLPSTNLQMGMMAVSGSAGTPPGKLFFYNGANWVQVV